MRLPNPPLLVITDRRQARTPLSELASQAVAGGCRWISIREKDLPPQQQIDLVHTLTSRLTGTDICLMIHGSAGLAAAAGAQGVHLPSGSDARAARAVLGPARLIGVSVHNPAEALLLNAALVDYAVAGPAFETASKPGYGPPLGAAGIAALAAETSVPIIAIGGISPASASDLRRAGVAGIAVMGGVMRAHDPAEEVRNLIAALASFD